MFNRHFCTIVVPTSNSLAAKPFSVIWGPVRAACYFGCVGQKWPSFMSTRCRLPANTATLTPAAAISLLSLFSTSLFFPSLRRGWRRVVYNKWCNTHGCHFIIFSQKSKDKRPQNVGRAHSTEIRYLPFACCAKKFAYNFAAILRGGRRGEGGSGQRQTMAKKVNLAAKMQTSRRQND